MTSNHKTNVENTMSDYKINMENRDNTRDWLIIKKSDIIFVALLSDVLYVLKKSLSPDSFSL